MMSLRRGRERQEMRPGTWIRHGMVVYVPFILSVIAQYPHVLGAIPVAGDRQLCEFARAARTERRSWAA